MPTRKLPSGKYQATTLIEGTKKYRSLGTFETEDEARQAESVAKVEERLLKKMGLDLADTAQTAKPKVIRRKPGRTPFAEYAHRHLNLRTLKRDSWHNYNWLLEKHLIPTFGKMALEDITTEAVEDWWIEKGKGSLHSRRQAYGFLSQVMNAAVEKRHILYSPCTIRGASKDVSAKRPTFTFGDVQMLMMLADSDQMRAQLWALLGSGGRAGEMLGLDWDRVDFENSTIRFNKHLTRTGMVDGTKSHDDGDRTLAMASDAMSALLSLYEERRPMPTDPVFLNARKKRMSYHTFSKKFVALRNAIGLEDINPHDFRHIHLSEFAKYATMKELMERAGHTDVRSALRYQHVDPARQSVIVAQMFQPVT